MKLKKSLNMMDEMFLLTQAQPVIHISGKPNQCDVLSKGSEAFVKFLIG